MQKASSDISTFVSDYQSKPIEATVNLKSSGRVLLRHRRRHRQALQELCRDDRRRREVQRRLPEGLVAVLICVRHGIEKIFVPFGGGDFF